MYYEIPIIILVIRLHRCFCRRPLLQLTLLRKRLGPGHAGSGGSPEAFNYGMYPKL